MATIKEKLNDLRALQDMNKDTDCLKAAESRDKIIIRTSIIGIVTNIFLAAFKAVVGLMSSSIAILLDAVNNLSDATSSIITIIGTKLAGKEPDKKHPFGYGRIEYLSAMVIALIVLYAGVTSFEESVKKIIHPDTPEYGVPALIIVAVAVVVKIVLGRFVKTTGERVNSDSLINSGEDATLDSIISASTLVAAGIYIFTGISLESWLGAIISLIIIKSGIEMLKDTLSQLLGERGDFALSQEIKKTVRDFPGVSGAYDLVLNNYGPDSYNGSIHIEVPDSYSADQLDPLIRAITLEVYKKHNVILTAIGVYSMNTKDPEAIAAREKVSKIVTSHDYILQMHAFYLDKVNKVIRFDMVISFAAPDRRATYLHICEDIKKEYPDYTIEAAMDTDFSEQ